MQLGNFRAAFAPTLRSGRLDQTAGFIAGRVAEARAGVGKLKRLRVLAPDEPLLQAFAHGADLAALEGERHGRDDRVARQRRVAVKILRRHRMRFGFARRLHPDLAHELTDLAIGARIHAQRAADAAWDAGEPIDSERPAARCLTDQQRQRRRGAGAYHHGGLLLGELESREVAGQPDDHAANAAVADQQVRTAAENEPRQFAFGDEPQHDCEFVRRFGEQQGVGRAADLPRRVRGERSVELNALGEGLAQLRTVALVEQRQQHLGSERAHGTSASSRASSAASR